MDNGARARKLLIVFAVWSLLAVSWHLYFAVYAQNEYLKRGDEISLRRGIIPAPRGQILDKNGVKLAWTETHYDLYLTHIPTFYLKKSTLFSQLELIFGDFELHPAEGAEFLIEKNLTPDVIHELQPFLEEYRELSLRMRFERCHIAERKVAAVVGEVMDRAGLVIGVSGLELEYDVELRGQAGSYVVMVDNMQRWITGKWELEQKVIPGIDIVLKKDVNELLEADDE